MERAKSIARIFIAAAMVGIGLMHFVRPAGFVAIVPKILPEPLLLVYVSGVFEVLLGAALLVPPVRKFAGWGLIALFIAVFPANVNMAVNEIQPEGMVLSPAAMWARLPFQIVFIVLAWWVTSEARQK